MKRRIFLLGALSAVSLAATATMALAASYAEDVVAQLVRLGFGNITAETTLLGRVKIVASRSDGVREIVINPRTGEILRDVWMPISSRSAPRTVLNDVDDNGDDNSGSGSNDDNSDDDNSGSGSSGDDDKSDDDNSGSGSGDDRDDDRNDDRDDKNDDKGDDRDNKKDD